MFNNTIFLAASAILCYGSFVHASENMSLTLRPGEVHESCHDLDTGKKMNYQYTGSSVTLFNVHYHQGKDIFYPVPDELAFSRNGSLTAASVQSYCLMWKNIRSMPVMLFYRIDIPSE